MVDKLIYFYSDDIALRDYIKWKSIRKQIFIIIITTAILTLVPVLTKRWHLLVLLCFPIMSIFIVIIEQRNIALCMKYQVTKVSLFKINYNLAEAKQNRLKDYLSAQGIRSKEALSLLITDIKARAAESNKPSYIKTGIFAALFIPVWIEYTKHIFSKTPGIDSATLLFAGIFLVIIVIWWLSFLAVLFINDIAKSNYRKLRSLVYALNAIYLTYFLSE
jgi:ABC-type multidrug transport system fused ATPase/permease subunit